MNEIPPPFNVGSTPAHLHARIVPWRHALAWYEEAMRLFKHAPGAWAALAVITILCEFLLKAAPVVGFVLSQIVAPLVGCSLFYAAAVADRRSQPTLALAFMAFRAPLPAIFAVVLSALVTFGAETFAAWWIADANLLGGDSAMMDLKPWAVAGIYAIGVLASLPVMFVAFHALFEQASPRAAFAASWMAFALNTEALLAYAAIGLVLLGFGILTLGLGLVLVLPIMAASNYAAWKDIFGIKEVPTVS